MKGSKRERIKTSVMNQLTLLSLELVAVILLSLIAVFAFYKLSILLMTNEIGTFDENAYLLIRHFASPLLDTTMLAITFLGDRQFVIFPVAGLIIFYLFIKPHRWYSIKIPAVALGSAVANLLLKEIYGRERPGLHQMVEVSNLSFPSGHAMFSMSFYGLLIYIVWKEANHKAFQVLGCIFLGLLIIAIGISRVYLGVHYASDIIAGFSAGFLWLVATLGVTNIIETRIKKNQQKASSSLDLGPEDE